MGRSPEDPTLNPMAPPVRGLSPSRMEQLRRDLKLSPEARVRAAEDTLRLDRLRRPGTPHRVLAFERYEDYLDYKFTANTGGE